jgi:hypothetical protein
MDVTSDRTDYSPSYRAAAIAAAAVFTVYLLTLAPSVAMWDTGEYMAAVKVLGIPHPPGNPFFMLLGHAFASLPIPVSYGMRINILAALASACSAGFWFLVTERIVSRWMPGRWERVVAAAVATALGATAFTVWNQSVVNEKVYTVSLLFFAIVSWLVLQWMDDPDSPRADRIIILVCFLLGLGYSNHPAGFLPVPAAALAVLTTRWRTLLRFKLVVASIGALIIGLTPFIYEPIRAAHFPAINEGAPTACTTELKAACTFDRVTWDRFTYNVERKQYPPKIGRQAPLDAQIGMWWLYFKWQWFRDVRATMPGAQAAVALLFLMLGLLGGYVHWRRDRKTFWYFGPLMVTMTLALIYYLNFKYGWSQDPGLTDVDREVRDRDYFYIWSYSAWGIWAAIGLSFLWEQLARAIDRAREIKGSEVLSWPSTPAFKLAAPIILVAVVPFFANLQSAPRSNHDFTQQWAHDYLDSLEPYAIVVTGGDNDTFPLWYAQEVEGVRRDVTVAVSTYLDTDWYARQLVRRPVETFDAAKGPALYRDKVWKKPTRAPLNMTLAQVDSIPDYILINQPQLFRQGEISLVIQPGYLSRSQIILLRLIKDAMPERPIYVSTGGGLGLPLQPYLLSQGFVQKIMDHPLVESVATPRVAGLFVDVDRTKKLWDTVYRAPEALFKEGDWIDRASFGIPYTYAFTGAVLAEALARQGDERAANAVLDRARAIIRTARLEAYLRI